MKEMRATTRHDSRGTIAAAAFVCALALYLWTAPGSIGWGDGPDFVLCSRFMGVAHPTGYPLVTLLGRLALELPAGDDAFRMTLVSVFAGAAAVAVFFIVASRVAGSALGLYATAVLAVSTFLWRQAVSLEVYTLNLLFFTCILAAVVDTRPGVSTLLKAVGIAVLGLGNHGTLVFPAALAGIWCLAKTGRRAASSAVTVAFLVALGFTLYMSLPVFSARADLFDWNMTERPGGLPALVSGLDFWVIGEYKPDVMAANAAALAVSVWRQSFPALVAGAALCIFSMTAIRGAAFLAGVFALSAFFPVLYPTLEKEAFFLSAYAALLIMGAGGLAKMIGSRRGAAAAVLAALAIAHVGYVALANLSSPEISAAKSDASSAAYSRLLLKSVRRDSLLFVDHVADDTIAAPLYLQFDENLRRDAFVFHRLYLAFPWYREYMETRARATGDSLRIPRVDMAAEKRKQYKISREEQARLLEGKTLNTVSIDIQTIKIYDANKLSRPVYINTPARFRKSVISEDAQSSPDGFAFRFGEWKVRGPERSLPPPSGGIMDEAVFDYLSESAYSAHRNGDVGQFVEMLETAIKYIDRPWAHEELAGAYSEMGETEKAQKHQKLFNERQELDDFN